MQPEAASALGERKARHIAALKPDLIATGNPGCSLQLTVACERVGVCVKVVHPVELLDESIHGTRGRSGA